jgi:hypothetical protein
LPIFVADAVDATAPALIIPVPFVKRMEGEQVPLCRHARSRWARNAR